MTRMVLALFLLQAGGVQVGTVTGIVRSGNGSPAAGVRVYAQQVRDTADANSPVAPLEGLAETDASGRYRLELPPGRYHIASGSVSAPTYYPGTTNLASAKAIVVASSGLVEGIDFGSFVAANRVPVLGVTVPAPVGVLAGTARYPDGTAAANIRVTAFPSSIPLPPTIAPPGAVLPRPVQTDAAGRYRVDRASANSYYIVAGFAETLGFYTGGTSSTQPKVVVLAAGAVIDSLDVAVPFPPPRTGTTIIGNVTAKDGAPATGATVRLVAPRSPGPITSVALPSINEVPEVKVAHDGTFTFSNVVPGFYNIQAFISNVNQFDTITVGNSPVSNLRLSLPTVIFSGRILLEDGRAFPDPELFMGGVVTTVSNPNLMLSTIMPLSADGTFAALPENNEYRFYFRNVPEEYEVRSIAAGTVDLLQQTLKIDGTQSVFVEARVAPRSASRAPGSVRVVGTSLDRSGSPSAATRVHLCCLDSNSLESISTALRPDGSFEFTGVPPGLYTVELRAAAGQSAPRVAQSNVEVRSDRVRVQLVSAPMPLASTMPVTIEIPKLP